MHPAKRARVSDDPCDEDRYWERGAKWRAEMYPNGYYGRLGAAERAYKLSRDHRAVSIQPTLTTLMDLMNDEHHACVVTRHRLKKVGMLSCCLLRVGPAPLAMRCTIA